MNSQYGEFEPLAVQDNKYTSRPVHERPKIFVKYVKGTSPFGVWCMVGIVFFVELLDHNIDPVVAALVTMLCMLLAVILS